MDIRLTGLRVAASELGETGCPANTGLGFRDFCADQEAWRRLMSQLGGAIAPPILIPADTTGHRKFRLEFETKVTDIDQDADYWRRGTEGDGDPVGENRSVDRALTWSRIALRKGIPFGLQLGVSAGRIYRTGLWLWGGEVTWSLFEGFREDWYGWIPDLAVRGAIQTATGDADFGLTVPTLDIVLSKPITIASTVTVTPIVGIQFAWIVASGKAVDLTPDRNAFEECVPEANSSGSLSCNGSIDDFNNVGVFDGFRAFRSRLALGGRVRYELFTFSAVFDFDLADPSNRTSVPDQVARQFSFSFATGLQF